MSEKDIQLGVLKRLDARTLWQMEASEFTPWLAGNLPRLGEALEMDLELQRTESPVGGFSLDLLARDLGRDRTVVIENQLERTDHDHLGKLITYASGHNAGCVIWIAAEIREEHRQALDWLNLHTDEDTEFFGVVVEVLKIDDSLPAVQFRPVAAPNTWGKSARGSRIGASSPRGEAYRRFFQGLMDVLRDKRFTQARKATTASWCSFPTGIAGIGCNPSFAQGSRVRAEIYIDYDSAEANLTILRFLERQKENAQAAFDEPIEWDAIEGKRACRVAVYRAGAITDSPEILMELREWFAERLIKLKTFFGPLFPAAVASANSED